MFQYPCPYLIDLLLLVMPVVHRDTDTVTCMDTGHDKDLKENLNFGYSKDIGDKFQRLLQLSGLRSQSSEKILELHR